MNEIYTQRYSVITSFKFIKINSVAEKNAESLLQLISRTFIVIFTARFDRSGVRIFWVQLF